MSHDHASEQILDLPGRSVGEIAARLPRATAVFRAHGIDFCCHGDRTLAEAVAESGVALDAISAQLSNLPVPVTGVPREPGALIDYILARYHAKHKKDLPELIELARRVEIVHRKNPAAPHGLSDFLQRMKANLDSHMFKEEMILFPALKRGVREGLDFPLAQMRREHGDHGEDLAALAYLTGNETLPEEACATWQALYLGIRTLREELMEHIHLENNVLFPQFE